MQDDKSLEYSDHSVYEVMSEVETLQPNMKEIIILNDDYTSIDFVINLLIHIFNKTLLDAQNITQFIHNTGEGSCGIYPYDIAELKYMLAENFIRDHGMPLRIMIRDV